MFWEVLCAPRWGERGARCLRHRGADAATRFLPPWEKLPVPAGPAGARRMATGIARVECERRGPFPVAPGRFTGAGARSGLSTLGHAGARLGGGDAPKPPGGWRATGGRLAGANFTYCPAMIGNYYHRGAEGEVASCVVGVGQAMPSGRVSEHGRAARGGAARPGHAEARHGPPRPLPLQGARAPTPHARAPARAVPRAAGCKVLPRDTGLLPRARARWSPHRTAPNRTTPGRTSDRSFPPISRATGPAMLRHPAPTAPARARARPRVDCELGAPCGT